MRDLELTYRRLLLAYPRPYRRERGLEILTTLMDAAASGRRRPSTRDKLDLVLSGLRFRFSPPRGWFHWALAALTSVFIGLTLAGVAAVIVWESSSTMPRPEQQPDLLGLAPQEAFGQPSSIWLHSFPGKDTPPRQEGWTGAVPAVGYRGQIYRPGADSLDRTMLPLYGQMLRDGWRVGELIAWEHGYVFWASRDGTIVRIQGLYLDGAEPSISVRTHLAEPSLVTPVAVGALTLGAIGTWLVVCGLSRRAQRIAPGRRQGAFVAALVSFAAEAILVPLMLGGLVLMIADSGWAQYHWTALFSLLAGLFTISVPTYIALAIGAVMAMTAPDQAVAPRREPVSS